MSNPIDIMERVNLKKALRSTAFVVSLATAALLVLLATPHSVGAQSPTDYDADNDGLIEIAHLEQLNAMRWDLNGDGVADNPAYAAAFPGASDGMGCPANHCAGYELTRSIDFDDASSYASGAVNPKWTRDNGWLPIGIGESSFSATFDGNDLTIANLYINRSGRADPGAAGLFGRSSGDVRRIEMIDVDLTGGSWVGGLVGLNEGNITSIYATGKVLGGGYFGAVGVGGLAGANNGSITHSYVTGSVSGIDSVGGLVGSNGGSITHSYATGDVSGGRFIGGLVGGSDGNITHSYATGDVSGDNQSIGGLVGSNGGSIAYSYATGDVSGDSSSVGGLTGWHGGSIVSSYATGDVSGGYKRAAGLVGENFYNATIIATYATGRVFGNDGYVGGFVGNGGGAISASYWDVETSGQSTSVGIYISSDGVLGGVEGKTTTQLQAPTGYSGIYADWNIDFDNADNDFDDETGKDDFWDFGASTDYPLLKADFDGDGIATWWEFGKQHGKRAVPTPTPTPTPTQTPAVVVAVVTSTPASGAPPSTQPPSDGGCNSTDAMSAGAAAGNLLLLAAPLGIIGGVKWRRRRLGSTKRLRAADR